MPSQLKQTTERYAAGLFSQHNRASTIPEGALTVAKNAVFRREGVLGVRRGFSIYQTHIFALPIQALFEFDGRLVVINGGRVTIDINGDALQWSTPAGIFSPPDTGFFAAKEAAKCFFMATASGVKRLDTTLGRIRSAGMPKGLDMELSLSGDGEVGLLPVNSQVGYRLLWKREDAHGRTIRGAASEREVVTNAAAAVSISWAAGVAIVEHAAHGYSNGDWVTVTSPAEYAGQFEITKLGADRYSFGIDQPSEDDEILTDTAGTVGKLANVDVTFTVPDGIEVGDRYELYRTEYSLDASADPGDELFLVTSRALTSSVPATVSFTDSYLDAYLGERLYSNETDEGAGQANAPPPRCSFIARFKGHTFYLRTKREDSLQLQFDSVYSGIVGKSIVLADDYGSLTVTFAATDDPASGQAKAFTGATSTGSVARDLELTAKAFCRAVNRASGSKWYAWYISGVDDPPGIVVVRSRTVSGLQFWAQTSDASLGATVTPAIPSDASLVSARNERSGAAARSKYGEPDHVPEANENVFGDPDSPILAVAELPESLLVFKEDGFYRLSGETDGRAGYRFSIDDRDPKFEPIGPGTAVVLDNAAWLFTDEGAQRVTANGSGVVSRQIEPDLDRVSAHADFAAKAVACPYDSEREYLLAFNGTIYVYNYVTNAWSTWSRSAVALHVLSTDGRLYHADAGAVYAERKSFTNDDYRDEEFGIPILSVDVVGGVTQLTVTGVLVADLGDGWLFSKDDKRAIVTAYAGGVVTLDRQLSGVTTGVGLFSRPIEFVAEWHAENGGNPASMKQFSYWQAMLDEPTVSKVDLSFLSDLQSSRGRITDIEYPQSGGFGSVAFGSEDFGGAEGQAQVIRAPIPKRHQRCRAIRARLRHAKCRERVEVLWTSYDTFPYSSKTESRPR